MTPISSLADTTGTSSERATRSAVRCRVPVSLVGTVGSGTRCTLARAMRPPSVDMMIAPSIFASSDRRCGLYGRIDEEPARADREHVGIVAQHEQRAGLRAHDAVDAVTQRRARGDTGERVAHRLVHAAVSGAHGLILDEHRRDPVRGPDIRSPRAARSGRCVRRARQRRSLRTVLRPGSPRCRRRTRASSTAPPRGAVRGERPR